MNQAFAGDLSVQARLVYPYTHKFGRTIFAATSVGDLVKQRSEHAVRVIEYENKTSFHVSVGNQ